MYVCICITLVMITVTTALFISDNDHVDWRSACRSGARRWRSAPGRKACYYIDIYDLYTIHMYIHICMNMINC